MPIPIELLERLKKNDPSLAELSLCNEGLNAVDIIYLTEALTNNTSLTALYLSYNQISDEGAKALATHQTLTYLDLSNNQIGHEGAKALANNQTLASLDLFCNQIGHEGAKALAGNKTLVCLELSGNQIGDEGAKALADNNTLISLSLCYNQIGHEGAKALANNQTLTYLYLSLNQIGNEGAKALATNQTLTSLDLSDNQIGDEGAEALATNQTLDSLELYCNQISADQQKAVALRLSLNQQQQAKQRSQFINTLFCLALDSANANSHSIWRRLPKDIQRHIVSFVPLPSSASIGKIPSQVQQCIRFVFENPTELRKALSAAASTQQPLKLIEKRVNAKTSQFRFFPLPAVQPSSSTENSQQAITPQHSDIKQVNKKQRL